MNIVLHYKNPSLAYCDVVVTINSLLVGVLTMRQADLGSFQQIIAHGCHPGIDTFKSLGKPNVFIDGQEVTNYGD